MNQRITSTLGYIGSIAAALVAAGLSSGNALAAGPAAAITETFEGGQAASTFAMGAPLASTVDRATVSAEGRDAARRLDSRSGYQGDAEDALHAQFTSTRSRAEVREEAVVAARDGGTQVFEGGQAGTTVRHMARRLATLARAGTATVE